MGYLIVEPKDKEEQNLIQELLTKMSVKVPTEDEEDERFSKAMKEVDFSKTVSFDILKKELKRK